MTSDVNTKPKLRGVFHAIAFGATCIGIVFYIFLAIFFRFNATVLIYLLSQLLQFGVSSFYHIPNWNPSIKRFMQFLDHISIFVLISGTQTAVLANIVDLKNAALARLAIKFSWTVSAAGILKIIITRKLHNLFDLFLYIIHGLTVAPFFRVLAQVDLTDKLLLFAGAVLYLIGGVIYGLESPNPFPQTLGFHEIFHILTVAANICFAATITRKYFFSGINGAFNVA